MPQLLHEQGTEEWLRARVGKITASLAAAALGLDPHTGPLSAYKQILGLTKKAESAPMRYGTQMQALALEAYEEMTGELVFPGGFWVQPELPWLGASPDGLVGADGLVEAKCPANLPTAIPIHHLVQVRVQLVVTGRKWCDYFAYAPHDEKRYFLQRVERDAEAEAGMLASLAGWFDAFIATQTPPPRRRAAKKKETNP